MTKGRRAGFALFTLGVTTILMLLAVEVILRLAWTPPQFRSDRPFGGTRIRGSAPLPGVKGRLVKWEYDHPFVHNGQRLRAKRNFTRELPPEYESRVLFLGDSFTYGLGSADDEIFVARVDAALPEVEVINGGCNGYGQREQLALLDTLGAAVRPDLTVLVFFWNDLEDNMLRERPAFEIAPGGKVTRSDLPARALRRHDPLEIQEAATLEKMGRSGISGLYLTRVVTEGLKGVRYRFLGIRSRSIQSEEEKVAAWNVTEEYLRMIALRAEEIGTDLLVVALPDHNRIDPEARIRGIEPLHFEVEETLAEVCDGLGVSFFDLTPALREAHASAETPLYYYTDRHLTPAGNAVVGRALAGEIGTRLAQERGGAGIGAAPGAEIGN